MIKKFFIFFVSVNLIAESIVIDGNLDEPEWQTAFKITEFYESDPYTLRKTDDETEAYIFSNEDGIYVGFVNYQDESTMLSNRTMRDEMSSLSEKNSINIDTYGLKPLRSFTFEKWHLERKTFLTKEMLKLGWLATNAFYASTVHTKKNIDDYLNDLDTVFYSLKDLDFDDDKSRIQLGVKQLSKHPWEALADDVKVGDTVKGKVVVH